MSFVFRWKDTSSIFHPAFDQKEQWSVIRRQLDLDRLELVTSEGIARLKSFHQRTFTADLKLPGGIRFGINPKSHSVWVEGRAAAMLTGDATDQRLVPVELLRLAALRVSMDLCQVFGLSGGEWSRELFCSAEVGIRRLDIAAELLSPSFSGLQVLQGFANCAMAGERKINSWSAGGVLQTIAFREKGRKLRFRIYDKGLEAGSHPAGQRLRFERQLRWGKADEPVIDRVGASEVLKWWRQGPEPWLGRDFSGHDVIVYPLEEAADRILKAADRGEITWQAAERLCGSLLVRKCRGEYWWKDKSGKRDAEWARLRQLKKLGVIPADVSRSIDLGGALRIAERGLVESPLDFPSVPKRKELSWDDPTFDRSLEALELLDKHFEEDPDLKLKEAQRRAEVD